jgi:hypothetical protein
MDSLFTILNQGLAGMTLQRHKDTKVWRLNEMTTQFGAAGPLCLCVFVVSFLFKASTALRA